MKKAYEKPGKDAGTCYFCGKLADNKEHVPPKSFFPEQKDLPTGSPNYRADLLTVPSCTVHNNAYSKDDEVAAFTILMHLTTNSIGSTQFATKAIRAIERRPKFGRRLIRSIRPVLLPNGMATGAVQVDVDALTRVMERVARGLHFASFGTIWQARLDVFADGLVMPDLTAPKYWRELRLLREGFEQLPREGRHPEVFYFQWARRADGFTLLRMCFYEGLAFYVRPDTDEVTGAGPAIGL